MNIRIEDQNKQMTDVGTLSFVEGEIDKNGKPSIYLLVEKDGIEQKLFFESSSPQEYEEFIKDLQQALRH